MSWVTGIPVIGGFVEKILGRVSADKDTIIQGQNQINQSEITGAPASRLRLWRSFLGWVLALVFAWEVIARPIVMTYSPDTILPPSMIDEIKHLLIGMLGLGL